jgi:hypothetical protein
MRLSRARVPRTHNLDEKVTQTERVRAKSLGG